MALDKFGQGVGKFLAWGTYLHKDMYNKPTIEARNPATISPSGFLGRQTKYFEADHTKVAEHVKACLVYESSGMPYIHLTNQLRWLLLILEL